MSGTEQNPSDMKDGKTLFQEGKYDDAITLLEERITAHPNDVEARKYLAASYSRVNKGDKAVEQFLKITEIEPGTAQHHCNLGIAYEAIGDSVKALAAFQKVLSLDPGYKKALERTKVLSQKLGKSTDEADKPVGKKAIIPTPSNSGETSVKSPPPIEPYTPPTYEPRRASPPSAPSVPESAPTGLNWGAFLLPFFWSLAHSVWLWAAIGLFFSPIASIVLLIKGNEVGWSSRRFVSLDQFRAVQKAWTIAGLIVAGAGVVLTIAFWGWLVSVFFTMGLRNSTTQPPEFPPMFDQMPEGFPPMPEGFAPMPDMDDGWQPQSDSTVAVTPYPGAQKIGGETKGRDRDGSYTSTSYKASGSLEAVAKHFEDIGDQAGNYMSNGYNTRVEYTIYTQGTKFKVDIESKGSNQVEFSINKYDKP